MANLVLVGVPCGLFCLSVFFTQAHGPYYLRNNFDPEYCYLLNSLSLLTFHSPAHTDHPGTTLQLIGAAVVWLQWLLGMRVSGQPLSESVLSHPEPYLRTINLVLNGLIGGALFWAGRSVYQASKSLTAAMLLQGTVLIYQQTLLALPRISPEPLLIAVELALMASIAPIVLGETSEADQDRLALVAGAIIGFGLITKVTFAPLVMVVLMFPRKSTKLRFGGAVLATSAVLLLPVLPRFGRMARWFTALIIRNGRYDTGSIGVPAAHLLRSNLMMLWRGEHPIFLLLALYGVVLLWLFAFKREATQEEKRLERLLLVACLAIPLSMLIGIKGSQARYLVPALTFTAFVNSGLYGLVRQSVATVSASIRQISAVLAAVFILVELGRNGLYLGGWVKATQQDQENILAVRAAENTVAGCRIVGAYRSSLQDFAISFGSDYSGSVHHATLRKLYPATITYNPLLEQFASFGSSVNPSEIRRMISAERCVLMEGGPSADIARQKPFAGNDVRLTQLIWTPNPIAPLYPTVVYRLDLFP